MDTPAATPATPTAPNPAPTMTPPQVVTTPPTTAANGATTPAANGSFKDSFKKAVSNPVQLGFGVLAAGALITFLYYLQYNIKFSKTFVKSVENKIDDLDMKYADVVSKLNKQETPQQDILQPF